MTWTKRPPALYLNANFRGKAWFASAGVRWISTDTMAKTAVDSIAFVDDPTPEIPTSSPDVTYSPAEPLTQKGSYDKFLPALNVGYWLRDDVLLRFAAAKVMARPSLNQLAPTRVDNTLDRTYLVIYDGNADLQPVEADQADLSAEWYFADKSVLERRRCSGRTSPTSSRPSCRRTSISAWSATSAALARRPCCTT